MVHLLYSILFVQFGHLSFKKFNLALYILKVVQNYDCVIHC